MRAWIDLSVPANSILRISAEITEKGTTSPARIFIFIHLVVLILNHQMGKNISKPCKLSLSTNGIKKMGSLI